MIVSENLPSRGVRKLASEPFRGLRGRARRCRGHRTLWARPCSTRQATQAAHSSTVHFKIVRMFSKVLSFKATSCIEEILMFKNVPMRRVGKPPQTHLGNFPARSPRIPRPTKPCASTVYHSIPVFSDQRLERGTRTGGSKVSRNCFKSHSFNLSSGMAAIPV